MMSPAFRRAAFVCGWLAVPLCPALEISEILTENEGGLRDADLSTPAWIEIRNETAAAVNLAGWRLTDNPALPAKWVFPDRTLNAGARLVVFASGKNRTGAELHTNFQLANAGEYLALISPAGVVATEFAPGFPPLRRNISYSQTSAVTVVPLVAEGSALRWRVPTNGAEGLAWTTEAYDDTAWASGPGGLGYDAAGGDGVELLKVDVNDRDDDTAANTQAGFSSFVIGNAGGTTATQTGPVTRTFGGYSMTVQNAGVFSYDDRQRAVPVNDGAFTQSNLLRDVIFSQDNSGTSGIDVTVGGLAPLARYQFTVWSYDSGSAGDRVSDWSANGAVVKENYTFNGSVTPTSDDTNRFTFEADADAAGKVVIGGRRDTTSTTFGVYFNGLAVSSVGFGPLIATNTDTAMKDVNATLQARAAFTVADPAALTSLRLRLRYDDGVAVYLNGQFITARNAPGALEWNSAATADRLKSDAAGFEDIVIPVTPGLLTAGTNVLALHGLNVAAGDADFLLSPVLEGTGPAAIVPRFYSTPTPGAANAAAFDGIVGDTHFSNDRGLYDAPFEVAITCETPDAVIRTTLNGAAPTPTTGAVYGAPIPVTGSTVLRAIATKPGWIPSLPDAQTYIFPVQAAIQPAAPAGWPTTWGTNTEVNNNDGAGNGTVPANYRMDPRIATSAVESALRALPVVTLSLAPTDFLGTNGIYQNPTSTGAAWERPCAVEFFDPSGVEKDWQETCVVEMHGNSSRRPYRMQKHSMRLSFRADAGSSKLRERVFPGLRVQEFNKLVLRACFTDSWGLVSWDAGRYRPDDSVYIRDVFMKSTHAAMGAHATENRWVHLYVNGLYWGCHNLCERVEEEHFAEHFGGQPEEWEVADDFIDPNPAANSQWKTMFTRANAGLIPRANYEAIQPFVNLEAFTDYYLLHIFGEAEDWPHKNGYAYRRKTGDDQRFYWGVWDQEIVFDNHAMDRISVGATNSNVDRSAGRLFQKLRENPEYRLLFADRAHRHLHNGGALDIAPMKARWQADADALEPGIAAESARWGDTPEETPYGNAVPAGRYYTKEADWLPTIALVKDTWFPALHNEANSYATVRKLRSAQLYPAVTPPDFSAFGGIVAPGFTLSMTAAGGAIHFTTDGSDPREAWTGTALGAAYTGPIALNATSVVKARALNGTTWSALTEARFIVGTAAMAGKLTVSEIHYNPAGSADPEYIEVMNISATAVDLSGVGFTEGIGYAFPNAFTLEPGQRVVISEADFTSGKLDNAGEQLVLTDALGQDIQRFEYGASAPWPKSPDGDGPSLVLIAPETGPNPALAQNWRPSTAAGGSPGAGDSSPAPADFGADTDGDGRIALLEYAFGTSDAAPGDATGVPVAQLETLTVAGEPATYLTLHMPLAAAADAAAVTAEASTDCLTWVPAVLLSRDVQAQPGGALLGVWRFPAPAVPTHQFLRLRVASRP